MSFRAPSIERRTHVEKLRDLHWFMLLGMVAIAVIGGMMLYSVSLSDPN